MNTTPLTLGIFILVAVFITFLVVPLLGTTLLWLTSKLWQFGDRTFKSSLKAFLIILGVMLATVWVTQVIFIKDFAQFAQSSPQSFLWFLFACFLVGTIVGVIAIKRFFQESLAKSIGAAITFSVFSGILFFIIITIITITIVSLRGATTFSGQSNQPEVTSQQAIIVKETIISGRNSAFAVNKYPKDAASWSLRFDCPKGIVGWMQSTSQDGKTLIGGKVNCNEDVALDKDPYIKYPQPLIFVMQFVIRGSVSTTTVNIVSKTFDSTGSLLNQSALPITVQWDIEALVESAVSNSRVEAELYYDRNGNSYAGVCSTVKSISVGQSLSSLSASVVCKDSQTAWAMSAQLKSDLSRYWCADSTGAVIVRNSVITTTSCK